MQIIKKINNNVALGQGENGIEFIVVGKGVGFPATPYRLDDIARVEKFFVNTLDPQLKTLFSQLPEDDVLLAKEIISHGKRVLDVKLSDSILLTLSDHLHQAFERQKNGVELKSPLKWGLRHMYADEIAVGQEALTIIWQRRGIRLPELEAAFIALHFINARLEKRSTMTKADETEQMMAAVDEILKIVKTHYRTELDEGSMNFTRFITHLQYFVLRQLKNTPLAGESENIYDFAKKEYETELICINKVANSLKTMYNWSCSNDEKFYLALHIRRLLGRENK